MKIARKDQALTKVEDIRTRIHEIRGQKVILDKDLARFYGVDTRTLNQAVKRNSDKFPPDFVFSLEIPEVRALISQTVISKDGRGGRRKTTYAFTEHGALMVANVLRSSVASQTSVLIIRAFIALRDEDQELRQLLNQIWEKLGQHDEEIAGLTQFLNGILNMLKAEKKNSALDLPGRSTSSLIPSMRSRRQRVAYSLATNAIRITRQGLTESFTGARG